MSDDTPVVMRKIVSQVSGGVRRNGGVLRHSPVPRHEMVSQDTSPVLRHEAGGLRHLCLNPSAQPIFDRFSDLHCEPPVTAVTEPHICTCSTIIADVYKA